jgi:cysteinyl-tRNA synthetase
LQSHYRSTLDFGNDALQGSEKALKRLWEAYENLLKMDAKSFPAVGTDQALEAQSSKLIAEFAEFMNDDLNTAKVLANMFELAPVINGIKGGQVKADALSAATISLMQQQMKAWLEDVFGLQNPSAAAGADDSKLNGVMQVLIELRRQARGRKDFQTSDAIRNQLADMGIQIKDEKDGSVSWAIQ